MYVYCSLLILQDMTHLVTSVFIGEKVLYNLQGLKQQVSK